MVIATKSGERRFDPAAGLSHRYIIQQVEHSLRRLATDYVDVYYAHVPDPNTPLGQTLMVYDDLVRQGRAALHGPVEPPGLAAYTADSVLKVLVTFPRGELAGAGQKDLTPPTASTSPSMRAACQHVHTRATGDQWRGSFGHHSRVSPRVSARRRHARLPWGACPTGW